MKVCGWRILLLHKHVLFGRARTQILQCKVINTRRDFHVQGRSVYRLNNNKCRERNENDNRKNNTTSMKLISSDKACNLIVLCNVLHNNFV